MVKAVLRAGAVVATSRCWSLEEVLRAEVVDIPAEGVEGFHSSACGEAIGCALVGVGYRNRYQTVYFVHSISSGVLRNGLEQLLFRRSLAL